MKIANWRDYSYLYVIGGAVAYLGLLTYGALSREQGLRPTWQLYKECKRIEKEIGDLQAENAHLKSQWFQYRTSLRTIEQHAREQLQMTKKNEELYFFQNP